MSFLTAVCHRPRTYALLALVYSCHAWATPATVNPDAITSGTLITQTAQGDVLAMPLLSTQVNTEVSGQLGKTELVQRFKNTSPNWVEAQYLFPLPTDAAVTGMRLEVGGRQIEGQIKEKAEASAIYEAAKSEGKNAALVQQHRPNLFSTAVSNIPPGGEVQVALQYQQTIEWRAKTFSLRFPMAITPRYTYIGDLNEAEQAMTDLFAKISRPALTNIHIEAQGITEITPSVVPDLYAGEPLQLAMKLQPGTRQITLTGRIGKAIWRRTIDITRVNQESGIRANWARQHIAQWLRSEFKGADHDTVRKAVLDLALTHNLVSPFTSLVAVDVTPVRPADADLNQQSVPPTRPKGLDIQLAQGATGYELTALLATLMLLLSSAGMWLTRRHATPTAKRIGGAA